MIYGTEFSSVFWWMLFLYFGFGKPNFEIGGVVFSLDRMEVKKYLATTFFHGVVKM